jgi:hypothetical protein
MNFNAFQRELANRGIDGPLAIMLTTMWEQILELTKQGDEGAKVMLALAESMENVVGLHEHLKGDIEAVRKRLGADDEMLHSVPLRDDN